MSFNEYLQLIKNDTDLNRKQSAEFLSYILDDEQLAETHIAEVLTILTEKKPAVDEICGFLDAMRARMIHVPTAVDAVDMCGTGGDKADTFNISTAAAIVVA